jgi:hypothetical protein
MLWYKGWLETRFKALLAMAFGLFFIYMIRNGHPASMAALQGGIGILAFYWAIMPFLLSGAGIRTQASFRATKGLHGSTYFTLSMPVSRFRLLAVRAAVGMLETLGAIGCLCFVAWIAVPALRMNLPLRDILNYWMTVSICVCGFYSLSILLASFFEEPWSIWAGMIIVVALRLLLAKIPALSRVDVFQAMGKSSPLFGHTLPWASMGISIAAGAILFFAALKLAQTQEY